MARAWQLCAVLLALLAGGATADSYGNSLSACVARAGLKITAAMIAAADDQTTALFNDGNLSLTFFAPDDNTWQAIAKTAGTTVQALLDKPGYISSFMKTHLLSKPYYTSFWPSTLGYPGKDVLTLDGSTINVWQDTQYTNRVWGFATKTRVACTMSDLQCGKSVMHVVVDATLPTQRK